MKHRDEYLFIFAMVALLILPGLVELLPSQTIVTITGICLTIYVLILIASVFGALVWTVKWRRGDNTNNRKETV